MQDQQYHFYRELCQLCISRSEQGEQELIGECGWCNDADTHYRTSHTYPGDTIQIDPSLQNYPYHHSPHPDREYYHDGEKIPLLRGCKPVHLRPVAPSKSKDDESIFFEVLAFAAFLAFLMLRLVFGWNEETTLHAWFLGILGGSVLILAVIAL